MRGYPAFTKFLEILPGINIWSVGDRRSRLGGFPNRFAIRSACSPAPFTCSRKCWHNLSSNVRPSYASIFTSVHVGSRHKPIVRCLQLHTELPCILRSANLFLFFMFSLLAKAHPPHRKNEFAHSASVCIVRRSGECPTVTL